MAYVVYTTRPPKRSTARLAWDWYVINHKRCPESVEYSSNYSHQHKGWICEHVVTDVLVKQMNYGGSSNYVFYGSDLIASKKEEINSTEYIEPKPVTEPADESLPTDAEIALFRQLSNDFIDKVRELYRSGVRLFDARDAVLKQMGFTCISEYFAANNCNVVANSDPNNPTAYSYRIID